MINKVNINSKSRFQYVSNKMINKVNIYSKSWLPYISNKMMNKVNKNSKSWFPCVSNKMIKKVNYSVGCYPMVNKKHIYIKVNILTFFLFSNSPRTTCNKFEFDDCLAH